MNIKFWKYELRETPPPDAEKISYIQKRQIELKAIDHVLNEMQGYVNSRLVPLAFRKMTDEEAFVVEMSIKNVRIYHMM